MLQASEFRFDEFWEIGINIFNFSTPHSIGYEFYSEFYIHTQNTHQNFENYWNKNFNFSLPKRTLHSLNGYDGKTQIKFVIRVNLSLFLLLFVWCSQSNADWFYFLFFHQRMKFIMIARFTAAAAAFLFGSVCIRPIAKEPYKHWTCGRKAKGNPKIKRKTKTTETKKINQKKNNK